MLSSLLLDCAAAVELLDDDGAAPPFIGFPAAYAVDTVEGGALSLLGDASSGEFELVSGLNVHWVSLRSHIVDVTPPSKVVTYGSSCRVIVTTW